jgi:hypothetical protein
MLSQEKKKANEEKLYPRHFFSSSLSEFESTFLSGKILWPNLSIITANVPHMSSIYMLEFELEK